MACAVIATIRSSFARELALALANRRRGLEAAHDRHLQIHEHDVEPFRCDRLDRFLSVVDDGHVMTAPVQQPDGHSLVDDVVLGEQDLARPNLPRRV